MAEVQKQPHQHHEPHMLASFGSMISPTSVRGHIELACLGTLSSPAIFRGLDEDLNLLLGFTLGLGIVPIGHQPDEEGHLVDVVAGNGSSTRCPTSFWRFAQFRIMKRMIIPPTS